MPNCLCNYHVALEGELPSCSNDHCRKYVINSTNNVVVLALFILFILLGRQGFHKIYSFESSLGNIFMI